MSEEQAQEENQAPPQPTLDPEVSDLEDEDEEGGLDAKKIVLFVLLPLFLLAGIGGGLYFTGVLDKVMPGKKGEEQHASKDAHGDGHGKSKGGDDYEGSTVDVGAYFLEIPNMIVNLSAEGGDTRYLRLSVQLELESQKDMQAVEAVMPRVVDQFQTYLRELRVKDLRGSQGIYRLQMELLSRVNAAAYPIEVKDVLFQEILIQ